MNRSAFIAKGALAVGAVYGMTMVGPFVRKAFSQGDMGDVEILNFALTLEYLESAFYDQAKAEAEARRRGHGAGGPDRQGRGRARRRAERDGVGPGGTPAKAPGVDFGNAFANQGSFLELAKTFEDTGVSAYNGAGPALKSKELLATAGSIVQVEARHAAAIRLLNGEEPAPSRVRPDAGHAGGPGRSGSLRQVGVTQGREREAIGGRARARPPALSIRVRPWPSETSTSSSSAPRASPVASSPPTWPSRTQPPARAGRPPPAIGTSSRR